MRLLRSVLGLAIMLASLSLMGPVLRLTDDLALRFILLPLFLALMGVGLALMGINRDRL